MSTFSKKAKTIIKNIGSLAIDRYKDAKIITSSLYSSGFGYLYNKMWRLINEGYASNTDAYSIISKIIRTGARIPFQIVEIKADGEEEIVTSGAFYNSVNRPNNRQNKIEFTEDALGYQLTTGNEFLTGTKPAGFNMITNVNIIPSQIVVIKKIGVPFI